MAAGFFAQLSLSPAIQAAALKSAEASQCSIPHYCASARASAGLLTLLKPFKPLLQRTLPVSWRMAPQPEPVGRP